MAKQILYGSHVIRLADDHDMAALVEQLGEPDDQFVAVADHLGDTHWLRMTAGVHVAVIDGSTGRHDIYGAFA